MTNTDPSQSPAPDDSLIDRSERLLDPSSGEFAELYAQKIVDAIEKAIEAGGPASAELDDAVKKIEAQFGQERQFIVDAHDHLVHSSQALGYGGAYETSVQPVVAEAIQRLHAARTLLMSQQGTGSTLYDHTADAAQSFKGVAATARHGIDTVRDEMLSKGDISELAAAYDTTAMDARSATVDCARISEDIAEEDVDMLDGDSKLLLTQITRTLTVLVDVESPHTTDKIGPIRDAITTLDSARNTLQDRTRHLGLVRDGVDTTVDAISRLKTYRDRLASR